VILSFIVGQYPYYGAELPDMEVLYSWIQRAKAMVVVRRTLFGRAIRHVYTGHACSFSDIYPVKSSGSL